MKLLVENQEKLNKLRDDLGLVTAILHLAPADLSGYNACPMASPNCKAACLNWSGRGRYPKVQATRKAKTRWFFEHRPSFLFELITEIEALERKGLRQGKQAAVRLNGTSDLLWENFRVERHDMIYRNVMEAFPTIVFYDYTKIFNRLTKKLPSNYHLTFSLSESNDAQAIAALRLGFNVAVVIRGELPLQWSGFPTIDGDAHDYRFLDPQGGYIVGLSPKAKAKYDTSGFVRNWDDELDETREPRYAAQEERTIELVAAA